MKQTTLSVSLEVKPEEQAALEAFVDAVRRQAEASSTFAPFVASLPRLHFLSMSVAPDPAYDPLFVLEANFDGAAGPFWGDLEAAIGGYLRDIIRCCKRPRDGAGPLYDVVIAPGSITGVAAYLERCASRPSVFHHGNRGLSRVRIERERDLFLRTRAVIDAECLTDVVGNPDELHRVLRDRLKAQSALTASEPDRIPLGERIADWSRLLAFAVFLLACLASVGLVAALLLSLRALVFVSMAAAIPIWIGIFKMRNPLEGTGTPQRVSLAGALLKAPGTVAAIVGTFLVVIGALLTVATWALTAHNLRASFALALRLDLACLIPTVLVVLPGLVLWLRSLELRDSAQNQPRADPETMRRIADREDWIAQNHMISLVPLKPGVLRTVIVHAGHHALHLWLRASVTNGYLGSMRTIHFAHWAFVNNGGRLMFHSNFDQSWESYLDDFIEKAHEGLTLAWGCGAGFPTTRFLIQDGASHGSQFKAWARQSMAVTRFWYSAYPDLTVDQIERNYRIATGLRAPSLTGAAAADWARDL